MTDQRIPGLTDPPPTPDNLNLEQWMNQVTEILRLTTGQQGTLDNAYVSWGDMIASGLFQPVRPASTVTEFNSGNYANGDLEQTIQGYDLTPPRAVSNVSVSSLVGAIEIEWLPPAVGYPHYFEVWRSTDGTPDSRVLIGTSSAMQYSDVNVADGVTYTYWIRVAKTVGNTVVYGIYDSAEGTQGVPKSTADNILEVVSEDMYIKTPGGNKNPFTYLNLGTDADPDWVVALRADVAVQGSLAVSQLESGELPESVTFSVGQGSITLDTRSDGSGQMVITGAGGIENNDYLIMNQGRIASFVWNGTEHVPYKEVRRIERGVSPAGQQVAVPAYFKAQPTVYLAPFVIPTYNPDYPTQGQQWHLSHSNVEPNPTEAGGWVFTPTAQLELTEGNATLVYPDRTYNGSSDSYETVITNRTSLKSCRVNIRVKSIRSTGQAGNYYNRQVAVQVWYRPVGSAVWLIGPASTIYVSQFNDAFGALDLVLPSIGNYDLKVSYTAADSGGTFSTGAQYDYTTRQVTPSPDSLIVKVGWPATTVQSGSLLASAPSLSGWTIYKTVWTYGWYKSGYASIPGASQFGERGTASLTRNYHSSSVRLTAGAVDHHGNLSNGHAEIWDVRVTYYYSKPITATPTPANNFYLDSIEYDQGAQQINPTDETILVNWLAVGE